MSYPLTNEKSNCAFILDKKGKSLLGNTNGTKINANKNSGSDNQKLVYMNSNKHFQAEIMKQKYIQFDEENNIIFRIENVRKELCKMVSNCNRLYDDEIVKLSQYLDELLVEYIDIKEYTKANLVMNSLVKNASY